MWKPGDVISWRGIYRDRVWHVQPTILVKDSPEEIVLTLLPGTECLAEETYPLGKEHARRWWDFKEKDWRMAPYTWHTNRFLLIFEPDQFYSTILFWNHSSHQFLCYYINFQLPFVRNEYSVDTRDLELDIVIHPDLSYEWKDADDYQKALEHDLLTPEIIEGIEKAKPQIFHRLEKRLYPFDGSWLDWTPNPDWQPPGLPANWDKI